MEKRVTNFNFGGIILPTSNLNPLLLFCHPILTFGSTLRAVVVVLEATELTVLVFLTSSETFFSVPETGVFGLAVRVDESGLDGEACKNRFVYMY